MKIRLAAFDKLYSGIMEVPEDTGLQFKLVMQQKAQIANYNQRVPEMKPLHKMATFEWSGYFDGGTERGIRIYKLVDIY